MVKRGLLLLFIVAISVTPATAQQTNACLLTVIIEGGDVYDGHGSDPVVTDVGILGDRIATLGDLDGCAAGRRLDARGLAVVPGFIDIHSHGTRGVFRYPLAENLTRQGVTTAIGGPDGSSPYPVGEYLAQLDATPPAVNFGLMVGHGTIRRVVMGNEDRTPTTAELDRMQAMVGRPMADGAFGLSSGLKYVPGAYAETEEVIALARVAGYFGCIYISHMREEGLQLLDAVRETIRIGEEGGLPTQITHHKVVGAPMWGRSTDSLALVDDARARGVDVTLDQYPYTASSTGLTILFPAWSLEGSREDLLGRLSDPAQRRRIKDGTCTDRISARVTAVVPEHTRERAVAPHHAAPADDGRLRRRHPRASIEPGAYADIAVLDRDAIDDPAIFENPHQYATGATHVFVNGVAVILDGEVTGTRPGRALRHER